MPAPIGLHARIADALLRAAELWRAPLGLPIQYPEVAFDPPAGLWLRAGVFRAGAEQITFGGPHMERREGVLLITVFDKRGRGLIPATEIADSAAAAFGTGRVIEGDDVVLSVPRPPRVADPVPEPDWISIPVQIPWLCETPHP